MRHLAVLAAITAIALGITHFPANAADLTPASASVSWLWIPFGDTYLPAPPDAHNVDASISDLSSTPN